MGQTVGQLIRTPYSASRVPYPASHPVEIVLGHVIETAILKLSLGDRNLGHFAGWRGGSRGRRRSGCGEAARVARWLGTQTAGRMDRKEGERAWRRMQHRPIGGAMPRVVNTNTNRESVAVSDPTTGRHERPPPSPPANTTRSEGRPHPPLWGYLVGRHPADVLQLARAPSRSHKTAADCARRHRPSSRDKSRPAPPRVCRRAAMLTPSPITSPLCWKTSPR